MTISPAILKVAKMNANQLVENLQVLGYGMRLLRINTVTHDIYYSKISGTNGRTTPVGMFIICVDNTDLMLLDRSRSSKQQGFDPYCAAQMDKYDCVYHNMPSSSSSSLRLHNAVHLMKRTGSPAVLTIRMKKTPVAFTILAFSPSIGIDEIYQDEIYLKLLERCTTLEPTLGSSAAKLKKEATSVRQSFTRMRLNPLKIPSVRTSRFKDPMLRAPLVSFEDPPSENKYVWGLRQYPLEQYPLDGRVPYVNYSNVTA
jgi:hypothetical protein